MPCQRGSVAAPTAGLHFTKELISALKAKGIMICEITLHVGIGTFRPVKCEYIIEHKMHSECAEISEAVASQINAAKSLDAASLRWVLLLPGLLRAFGSQWP
jgi:S-adenosylmethionine:tRNA ribosyltransferase-isomerase